jgi:phage tail-like protein
MRQPAVLHLTGRAMWERCDHAATRIEGAPARVTLATAASIGAEQPAPDLPAWRAAMGAAVMVECPPDLCDCGAVVLADPVRGLLALRDGSWVPLGLPEAPSRAARPMEFAPAALPAATVPLRGIAHDPLGRVWLLDGSPTIPPPRPSPVNGGGISAPSPPQPTPRSKLRGDPGAGEDWGGGGPALRLLGRDLRLSARLPLPVDSAPFEVGCTSWGVVVADGAAPRLFLRAWGGEWVGVALPAAPLSLAADPRFGTAAVVLEGRRAAILRDTSTPAIHRLPALRTPLHALMTAEDRVLVADVAGTPGAMLPTRITEFLLTQSGPEAERGFAVRGFDGRALWLDDDGRPMASTATGARPLYAQEPRYTTEGAVETFALDSGVFACVWHRVFLDACVPPGTNLIVEARTADTLPPRELQRAPRPPADRGAPVPENPAWPPLGTLAPEEGVGWSPLGILDRRPAYADTPLPPFATALPSEDPLWAARGHADPPPEAVVTLEGVVKAPPGRWLWLRIRLTGTERRAPALFALRATCPRPSLMDLLPAYWRGDPVAADATDRALSLFEGFVTETDVRITALRHLLSASTTPREALDWLASFLALVFDARVAEDVRRSLLAEAMTLWRQRGTMPGLTRMLSILARAPVQVIEGFRLRRESTAVLGAADWGVLGPGLQIGADEGLASEPDEAWERALALKHAALVLRRAAARAEGNTPCPEDDPPDPLDPDPLIRFHRRHAHRFTVVVPALRTEELAAVLDLATETHKPAHTIHQLCWLDAGFRLGAGSLVGIARIGAREGFRPAVLGAPLGTDRTVGRAAPDDRWRLGATHLQHRTRWP